MLIIENNKYFIPVFWIYFDLQFCPQDKLFVGWWSNLSNSFINGHKINLNKIIKKYDTINDFSEYAFERLLCVSNHKLNDVYFLTSIDIYKYDKESKALKRKLNMLKKIIHTFTYQAEPKC